MKWRTLAVAVASPLFFLAGCKHEESPTEGSAQVQSVIETITVHPQPVSNQLLLAAHVMANPTSVVHLFPPISGRVVALKVLPGQEVIKGQELGMLQSSNAAQARSDFEKAKIEAARADLQLQRGKELLQHEVLAQRDYDDLKALDDADHAELNRARQALVMLGFSEDSTSDVIPIRSPITGVVLDVGTGTGELQRSLDNATAIATIADINPIWVVGDLYPRDLASVKVGQPVDVTVTGYPGQVYHRVIDNISDAVDPATLTLKVRIVLPNSGHKLKPQMYATIAVTNQKGNAIVVPSTAVIQNGKATFVFVQSSPGKYVRRDVTLGAVHDTTDEIIHGLEDGDKVVSTGAELLRESED
ncbi:putative Co/Zn/Cd efflux system membrane fusion protein [Acidisarcina polymorpha]|uniref:Putative Co/Zn/Cd efflux system membrane fusion protein n=1 Tax=Acidisarcina polymorpha TaxID=2211140 RepID=A0A2Z5G9Q7_9BACT|nr:efflux RND transporter periplasmic adaptor subunit [Acidisarcina polymorpha]AXC15295.1 putative Co/Zn/Cd efflux system membrane fusion protein [Acidisarcina polymorpha]